MINLCQILLDRAKSVPDKTYIYKTAKLPREPQNWQTFSAATPKSRYSLLSLKMQNILFILFGHVRHLGQTRLLMNQVGANALVTDVPELILYGLSSLLEYTFIGSTIALPRGISPLGVGTYASLNCRDG